ncbi:hypothetical protein DXA34_08870 [[Clostridium] symbiosum]|nr:hypothetical protein DXA34_08870 [[Clostridium] symbiosum]
MFYSLLTRLSAGDRIFLSDSLKQSLLHCLYMKFYGHHYIPFLKTCKALFEISRIFSIFFIKNFLNALTSGRLCI